MKIYLTGATGYIGKNIVESLSDCDIVKYRRGEPINIPKDTEHIIHCASEQHDEKEMFDSNIKLTYDLLEASKRIDYKSFIHIGSSSEYGRKEKQMKEADLLEPTTLYATTKACASLLCQHYALSSYKPIIILRPFSVYGKYEPETRLIPSLFDAFQNKKAYNLLDGFHDFVNVKDLVRFIKIILDNPFKIMVGDIVNICTGKMTSNLQVMYYFEKIFGYKIDYKYTDGEYKSGDSFCWVGDPCHAKKEYGFVTEYDLERGLTEYINERLDKKNT